MPDKQNNPSKQQMSLLAMAWSLVGALIGCPLIGYWVGAKFDQSTVGVVIGLTLGLFYSFYELWKIIGIKNK